MSRTHVPGTPGLLRTINDRAALELLLDTGPMTRSQIGDLTGVSRPTSSQIVARLESAGLIEPTGAVQGARGPQAVTYAARTDVVVGLALDVLPGGVQARVVDARGAVLGGAEVPTSADRTAVSDVRAARDAACADARVPVERVGAIVVGVQAAADPTTGDLWLVGDLPGWPRLAVRSLLEQEFGIPVHIENDVNLATIAEQDAGRCDDTSFSLLWIGQGIGLGTLIDGRLHHGATGAAGELGYLPVPVTVREYDDHSVNLQDLVGGRRLEELAVRYGVPGVGYTEHLAAMVADPDSPAVVALVEDFGRRLATVVQPVVAVVEPHLIVLSGPTCIAGGQRLADATRSHLTDTEQGVALIVPALAPSAPVLRGAQAVVAAEVRALLLDRVSPHIVDHGTHGAPLQTVRATAAHLGAAAPSRSG
ncbi:ROK family protein [Oerskovia jenensis]|uniref:NBD/HSP70 family sugar kinase n=1 Tax=Oerskovia jenensis TaxID=162169 RepID=A0ABS2LJL2_9CELL|nr:ROK family transcriptional regulator [Oerskovia jenensis]MBM7480575.1 putative NBD/HSP70 family sugar kinase [Oerskovia jenensis]